MEEKKKDEVISKEPKEKTKKVDEKAFIERKLKIINDLDNQVVAKSASERLLRSK